MPTHILRRLTLQRLSIALALFLMPAVACAQGNHFPSLLQESFGSILVYAILALNLLTWMVFLLLNVLLDPEFVFGGMINTNTPNTLEAILNTIWMLSRDLVNIAFAFILIGAAVYTVVTAKKDLVAPYVKSFVLAVVLVNFSWFIPRLVLDVANISTAVVFGIPSLIQNTGASAACTMRSAKNLAEDGIQCQALPKGGYDCQCVMITGAEFFMTDERAQGLDNSGWFCPMGSVLCVQLQNLDPNAISGQSTILNGLIINHGRLQQLAIVPPTPGTTGQEAQQLLWFLLKSVMILVIHIALFFPLAALVVALAVRIPILWLTIAFMPFAVLKYVLPDKYTGGLPEKIIENFTKAAFLPAIVGIPLAVGYILVNAGANFVGAPANFVNWGEDGLRLGPVSNFYQLLWLGMTLGVLWTAVFASLEKMGPYMNIGANFFKEMGKSIGGIALKAPLSLPLLPGPAGGAKRSPVQLAKALDPRAINYQLNNSTLPEVLAGIKGGKGGATEAGKVAASVRDNKENFTMLNDTLKRIATELAKPNGGNAEKILRDELRPKFNASGVDLQKVDTFARDILEDLRKNGTPHAKEMGDLATTVNDLANALKQKNTTTPPKP